MKWDILIPISVFLAIPIPKSILDIVICESRSVLDFKQVEGLEDFRIVINGMSIDSKLSKQDRAKYYSLCRSQGAYLHDHLLEDVNTSHWAASIVSKTVLVADSIKDCNFTTPRSEFDRWDKILNSFEVLGLNVGFLRARLRRLVSLAVEVEAEIGEMVSEAEEKIEFLESEIQRLEEKKEELVRPLEAEIQKLGEKKEEIVVRMKERNVICKNRFKEVVDDLW